ncbi:hypothetical protein WA158_001139 [Blastocystis sp. Blastoise]
MNKALLLLFFILPFVNAYVAEYGPFDVNGYVIVYKGTYTNIEQTSSKPMYGNNTITVNLKMSGIDSTKPYGGSLDLAVISERVFKELGYKEGEKNVICCDPAGVAAGNCKNLGHLIIDPKNEHPEEWSVSEVAWNGQSNATLTHYVKKSGVYFIVSTVCDSKSINTHISGDFVVKNTYGQLPSITYGSLSFYFYISIIYTVLTIAWLFACYIYKHEIMSVQYTIIIVVISFTLDSIIKVIYLNEYNNVGVEPFTLGLISIAIDCFTKTITRILTLVVSMGLGVSSPTLGVTIFKLIVLALVYFGITFWDTYCTIYSVEVDISYPRLVLTTLVDTIIYFLIFQALVNTMEELTDKNQTAKLSIFKKFRNIIIVAVIVSTVTILAFTYIAVENKTEQIWTYQWFINEGVWSCFYLAVLSFLWRPTENISAYAYRMQIATEEKADDAEYGLTGDQLVDDETAETIEVVGLADEMKPMTIEGAN